jgi:cation:H+ antiporter
MVVGLTVVGFGTSMPEFSVSVLAAIRGSADLSLGNAVGSNIMNLLLVLGAAAVVAPIHVVGARRVLLRDLVAGLIPPALLMALAWEGRISRPTACLLLLAFASFMWLAVSQAKRVDTTQTIVRGSMAAHLGLTLAGIAVLVLGSEMLVRGGVEIARRFEVSEAVIGLTLVAFGTSLPELATSVTAVLKGESEIGVGNVLGSNIFNLGAVVGLAFAIRPAAVTGFVITQDLPILVAATILTGAIVLRDGRINRWEGAVMVACFVAYVAFIAVRGG